MTFRDLKQNSNVHFLDKEALTYEEARVEAVGMPRFATPQVGQTAPTGQVVDITIKGTPYVVGCDNSIAYSAGAVFSTERAQLLPEVRRMKTEAEAVLAGVEKARETIGKCDALLCELDTAFKERQEQEARMNAVEGKLNTLSDMLRGFIEEMKK